MATKPYKMPLAASEKATGKPNSKNTIRLINMIGARLSTKNSMINGPCLLWCCYRWPAEHLVAPAAIFLRPVLLQPSWHAGALADRSEEHTSELQSLMRISYAVFCLKKKKTYCTKYSE